MNIFKRIFKPKVEFNLDEIILSQAPESMPINFGEKCQWTCVKNENIKDLLEIFKLKEIKKDTWKEAFKKENDDYIFVFGHIEGWIILKGGNQVTPDIQNGMMKVHEYLNALSRSFHEVQYFMCQRSTSTAIWVKSMEGKIIRSFCIADEFFKQIGLQTEIEVKLGISDENPLENFQDKVKKYHHWPDLTDLIEVAQNWSINPMKFDQYLNVPKNGFLIKPTNQILELK